jgi:hypothetical protein
MPGTVSWSQETAPINGAGDDAQHTQHRDRALNPTKRGSLEWLAPLRWHNYVDTRAGR